MVDKTNAVKPLSRGDRTKNAILDVSLKLFAVNGYKATSVRDIAGELGIKQSALYNHFKSKDEILSALISELTSSAIAELFSNFSAPDAYKQGKMLLLSVATTFKLISFDSKNEALFKLLMQEIFNNINIREIYNEYFYQENVKKLSSYLFSMMQDEMIKSSDPILLSNEFFAPLFFYQMQITLLKIDKKSTSFMVSLFEKHVEFFWDTIKIDKKDTLF
ncbi:MAG: TetR family transcriptional regulator [Sulfurovum sp. AS07-7]|nr:MAG: TetR family transcriptional regulator [Sulfurovum sp. AS07-7]